MHAGARALVAEGRFADAAATLERELATMRAGGHPFREAALPPEAAPLLEQLGTCRWRLARFDAAGEALDEARRLREARGDGEAELAHVIERQAALAHYRGDPAAAALFRRAIAAHPDHSVAAWVARRNFGAYLRDSGAFAQAARELEPAAAALRDRLGDDDPEVAAALKAVAMLRLADHVDAAIESAEEALAATLRAHPEDHPYVGGALLTLGKARDWAGDGPGAESALRGARERFAAGYGASHPLVALSLLALAELAFSEHDLGRAADLAEEAVRVYAVTYHGHRFMERLRRRAADLRAATR